MTRDKALEIARRYGLEDEVRFAMQDRGTFLSAIFGTAPSGGGMTPEEALEEWDLPKE